MSAELNIDTTISKEEKYIQLLPQIKSLVSYETDTIANMANVSAVLKQAFDFLWVGFYIVKREELVLGPFQGKIACTRIKMGQGVCGTSWKEKRVVRVPNVNCFEGHIICDSESLSEIVIPLFYHDNVIAVLDVDSEFENYFDDIDEKYLMQIAEILSE